jgi:hypothetical protein
MMPGDDPKVSVSLAGARPFSRVTHAELGVYVYNNIRSFGADSYSIWSNWPDLSMLIAYLGLIFVLND